MFRLLSSLLVLLHSPPPAFKWDPLLPPLSLSVCSCSLEFLRRQPLAESATQFASHWSFRLSDRKAADVSIALSSRQCRVCVNFTSFPRTLFNAHLSFLNWAQFCADSGWYPTRFYLLWFYPALLRFLNLDLCVESVAMEFLKFLSGFLICDWISVEFSFGSA